MKWTYKMEEFGFSEGGGTKTTALQNLWSLLYFSYSIAITASDILWGNFLIVESNS